SGWDEESPARPANSPRLRPLVASTCIRLSVEGQRGRGGSPGPSRFDGLKLVASSPARRANPDAERPSRRAKASIAFQSWEWDRGKGANSEEICASVYSN